MYLDSAGPKFRISVQLYRRNFVTEMREGFSTCQGFLLVRVRNISSVVCALQCCSQLCPTTVADMAELRVAERGRESRTVKAIPLRTCISPRQPPMTMLCKTLILLAPLPRVPATPSFQSTRTFFSQSEWANCLHKGWGTPVNLHQSWLLAPQHHPNRSG